MLCADLVPTTNNAPLKQRECRLNGVSRDAFPIFIPNELNSLTIIIYEPQEEIITFVLDGGNDSIARNAA